MRLISHNKIKLSLVISLLLFTTTGALAAPPQSGITYHGRIIKPDGQPLQSSEVKFRVQVRSLGAENCILFEELHTQDLSNSAGIFAVTLNDGNGTRMDSTGYTIDQTFANRGTYTVPTSTCVSGSGPNTNWSPNAADGRRLQVYFKDAGMSDWEPMPSQTIDFVPMAIEAKHVGGFSAASLLRVEEASGPQSVSALSQANYDELMKLILGTTTQYSKAGQLNGSVLPAIAGGQSVRWNGSAWQAYTPMTSADETDPTVKGFAKANLPICGANEFLSASGINTWSCVAVSGSAGGTVTSIIGGAGLTGGTITSTGTFAVDVGTTANKIVQLDGTAKLPAVDGSALTNITGANILGTIDGAVAIDTSGDIETSGNITGDDITATGNVTAVGVSTTTVAVKTLELYKPNNAFKTTIIPLSTLAADYTLTLPPDDGAANQVLQTDGSGVLTWATPLTSGTLPVATTGAQGIMQVGAGLAVTTGTVSADFGSTTGKIAEGDDDRLNPAPIIADALKIPRVTSGGIAYENVTAATVVTSGGGVVNGGNTLGAALIVGTNDAQSLAFETNNSTAMTILNSGNVGIGTTSPEVSLDVSARTDAVRFPLGTTAQRPASPANGMIRYNSDNSKLESYIGGGWQDIAAAATGGAFLPLTGGTLSGALTISSGGAAITGNTTIAGGTVSLDNNTFYSAKDDGGVSRQMLGTQGDGTVALYGYHQTAMISGVNGATYISGSGGGSTALTVLQNGNVGVGITTPGYKLAVDGGAGGYPLHLKSSHADTVMRFENTAAGGRVFHVGATATASGAGSGFSIYDVAATATRFLIEPAGKVGIGTQTPNSKLSVVSASGAYDGSGTGGIAQFTTGTGANVDEKIQIGVVDGSYGWIQAVKPGTAARSLILNPGDGNVGIGTTTPIKKLEVAGEVRAYNFYGPEDSAFGLYTDGTYASGSGIQLHGTGSGTPNALLLFTGATLTERMRIDPSGNVGIGTTTPASKLDVAGEVKFGNTASTCNATNEGQQRYNSTSKKMEFCNATAWTEMGGGGSSAAPAGIVVASAAAACPTGYLLANGAAISRATYASLFTAISTMYGAGDGSTTFNLPDYRGYFLRSTDDGTARDPNAATRTDRGDGTTGDAVGTKQTDAYSSHNHGVTDPGHGHNASGGGYFASGGHMGGFEAGANPLYNTTVASATTGISIQNSGGSETRPKNINVLYCISTGS